MKLFIYYLILMNIFSFAVFWIDKEKAKKRKWRVSEKNLFLLAILLGSPGCILGMHILRHKTKHPRFYLGMPVILIFQIVIFYLIYKNF